MGLAKLTVSSCPPLCVSTVRVCVSAYARLRKYATTVVCVCACAKARYANAVSDAAALLSSSKVGFWDPVCLALCRRCRSRPTLLLLFGPPSLVVPYALLPVPALCEDSGLWARLWRSSGQHLPLRGSELVWGLGFTADSSPSPPPNWLCNQRH